MALEELGCFCEKLSESRRGGIGLIRGRSHRGMKLEMVAISLLLVVYIEILGTSYST